MKYRIIYSKSINTLLRNFFRPFSAILPSTLKFPINGTFSVRSKRKDIPNFLITTNPTSYFSKKLFWDGIEGFEYNTVRIFCEFVKKAETFIDIGSNIGYYSLLASAINDKIRVHAFEPMPSAYEFLRENIKINGFSRITAVNTALSSSSGNATFYAITNEKFRTFPQLTGDGGLNSQHSGLRSKVSFEVIVDTLDDYVRRNKVNKVDIIKLDAEANEHHVLRGANMVLRDHRPIIQVEILKGHNENDVYSILKEFDYLYFLATEKGLMEVHDFTENTSYNVDYFLIPREKFDSTSFLII